MTHAFILCGVALTPQERGHYVKWVLVYMCRNLAPQYLIDWFSPNDVTYTYNAQNATKSRSGVMWPLPEKRAS